MSCIEVAKPQAVFAPKTLVSYKGGGYDGCVEELNFAWIDAQGKFHDIASSGYRGCDTVDKLLAAFAERRRDFDLYDFSKPEERVRAGRELPITMLLGVSRWLHVYAEGITIPVRCDDCGETVGGHTMHGEALHGIGGVMQEYRRIVCSKYSVLRTL